MISFVWYSKYPFLAGAGGTEVFTAGVVRELLARGCDVQVVTVGFGTQDGRDGFPDIPFLAVKKADDIATLDGKIIFALDAPPSSTPYPAYFMLHCPVWLHVGGQAEDYRRALQSPDRIPIANSRFAAREWERFLNKPPRTIPVVYPFADAAFSSVQRPKKQNKTIRVLYAGRLHQNKGIYTFMAALHDPRLQSAERFSFDATSAADHTPEGRIIKKLITAHPRLQVVAARKTPQEMALLFADYDIVVVPSSAHGWRETFGMTSVEAQKAGCYVVASNDGGLPETDCGNLILVEPDNPVALAGGIVRAADLAWNAPSTTRHGAEKFTVQQTVNDLLRAIDYTS